MINKLNRILLIENDIENRDMLRIELSHAGYAAEIVSLDTLKTMLKSPESLSEYLCLIIGTEPILALPNIQLIRLATQRLWVFLLGAGLSTRDQYQMIEAGYDGVILRGTLIDDILGRLLMIRRRRQQEISDESVLRYDDITMDLISREVRKETDIVELRSKEFDLLRVFMKYPEEVLSRATIFNQVWGFDFIGDSNVIEVYIRYLRTKLGKSNLIRTKRGQGYIMISDESQIQKANIDLN